MNIVLKGIDNSRSYRVYLTITTDLVEKSREIHNTTPLATAGLGRVLTGAGLMGLLLKNKEDKLTVQFKGDGPAKQILATAYGDGRVKGYIANPDVDLPLHNGKLDVGGSLGIGQLTVIKDLGLKEPYVGKIDLVTGEIADDLTAYYYISEQQNSSVALGVKVDRDLSVKHAGGMFIQMLPNFTEESVDALEDMLRDLPPLTTLIEEVTEANPLMSEQGLIEALKERIFGSMVQEYQVETLEYDEIKWECDCSKDKMSKALMTIGVKDLSEIIEEDGKAQLVCQFCESEYDFTKEELVQILDSIK